MGDEQISAESNTNVPEILENHSKTFTIPENVFDWRKFYLKEGHSVGSTTTYFNYIKMFVGYGTEINQKNINKFQTSSISAASVGALKNYFQFLVNKKDFPQEILHFHFDKAKSKKKFPESFNETEVVKIINAMPGLLEKNFTYLLSDLGLRISEGLKLKWDDFNWSIFLQDRTKKGSVNLKNTKGGKFRTIPVSPELMNKLYNDHANRTSEGIPIGTIVCDFGINNYIYRKEFSNDENLFAYFKYAGDRYRKLLDKITKELFNKTSNPHMFRHFKAQYLMDKGLSIESLKEYLGHASIVSTSIYAHSSAGKLIKDMDDLGL